MDAVILRSASDDWEGLYIDGVLKCEGHSISATDVLNVLNITWSTMIADEEYRSTWMLPTISLGSLIMNPVCVDCKVEMTCKKNGVLVASAQNPTYMHSGDKYMCPVCGQSVVIGFRDGWNSESPADIITEM